MKYNMILKKVTAVAIASAITLSCNVYTRASTYTNSDYSYDYQRDGDYKDTAYRAKNYNGSDTPHGYVYAIAAYGLDSSVMVRGTDDVGKNSIKCSEYVTIPIYKHTCIRNTFNKNKKSTVRLRVRTNSNKGETYGCWSPDSSKKYSRVVG